jgi:hypothetical protein
MRYHTDQVSDETILVFAVILEHQSRLELRR